MSLRKIGREALEIVRRFASNEDEKRDDHGRWTSGGGISRVDAGEKFTDQDAPDDYYYHVTLEPAAQQIEGSQTIKPGRGNMGRGAYAGYSKGKVFLTDRNGVSFWSERAEAHAFDQYDDPPNVSVVKIKKSAVKDVKNDAVGSQDAHAPAYYVEGPISVGPKKKNAAANDDEKRDDHGRWTAGGGLSGGEEKSLAEINDKFPRAPQTVDGREVGSNIPNQDSIDATLTSYDVLPGVREVSMHDMDPHASTAYRAKDDNDRVDALIDQIKESNRIDPLILVVDSDRYPYVLEGGHRFSALKKMGAKSFPAKIVIDRTESPSGVYFKDATSRVGAKAKMAGESVPRGVTFRETVGPTRVEQFQGKDYVVLPIVALVEGVIWPINSPHPDLVPESALRVAPGAWDGRPVMAGVGHPVKDGEQVSANTPDVLTTSIGMVFNARVEDKRLLMDAWIDPTMPEAQRVLARVQAGELVEVSVGVLVVEETAPGTWGGKPYFAIWRVILPDHLAILPEGDEGACSGTMGCGIRTATRCVHLVTAAGVELTQEARVKVTNEKMTAFLKTAVDAADPFKELQALDEGVCVYETAAGTMYRQAFEDQADETVKFVGDRMEVAPVMYFEPAGVDLKAAKGARHSQTDMARIQAMHDHTVDLGAQCAAAPKAAAAAPCGCTHKEQNMARTAEQRTALVTTLKSKLKAEVVTKLTTLAGAKGDIIDAIIAQIKDKLGLSDAAAADIANLDEATIVELAGLATAESKEPDAAGGAAAAVPAAAAAKPETEAEFLARNPALNRIVAAARSREAARKEHLVGVLKTAQTHFKEADLLKMDLDRLEEVAVLCKANVVADVDFGVQAPRVAEEEADGVSPEPIDLSARIKAARAKK